MIDEVKKILYPALTGRASFKATDLDGICGELAYQICQLFEPKPLDEKLDQNIIASLSGKVTGHIYSGESKADRLLAPEEINDAKQKAYRHESRLSPAAFDMFGRDLAVAKAQRDLTASIMRVECQEGVKKVLMETGVELEKWMNKETAPYKRLAQAGHAIARLKRGQTFSVQREGM